VQPYAAPAPSRLGTRRGPAMTTADHTQKIGRVAVHGSTVHYRAAPQHLGNWLRRIDLWIDYANSVVEE
jgi:hypothetical protein